MRRFEFVEGTSAKFWMGGSEGNNFIVVYGKLGTAGTRKEKAFPSEEAARREADKKIAEKLREGYYEVAADAVAAPGAAKGAAAKSAKLELPERVKARPATADAVSAAVAALGALEAEVGKRSWRVARRVKVARRSLEAISGVDPSSDAGLAAAFDAVMKHVVSTKRRLSLPRAMELLGPLDVAAFTRALAAWGAAPQAPRGVAVLVKQVEALEEPELALRLGTLLVDRPAMGPSSSEAGWRRRWLALSPHLESFLVRKGTTLKKYVGAIDAMGDPAVTARIARLRDAQG
jgi:predicted DNA-binding WGR domain protein